MYAMSSVYTTIIDLNGNSKGQTSINYKHICQWISDLTDYEKRENALKELSAKQEMIPDLAIMLWYSFGAISALLQEIVSVYPITNLPTLTDEKSERVCNALSLLYCIASHPETRSAFLEANIPLYLYPFLDTIKAPKTQTFDHLQLKSLGVIGALVKGVEKNVIKYLLTNEVISKCLKIMERGCELRKIVATFIIDKILSDETGLSFVCQTHERIKDLVTVLENMVMDLVYTPNREKSSRLLKHVIKCYLSLSGNARAREIIKQFIPKQLYDSTFVRYFRHDLSVCGYLEMFFSIKYFQNSLIPKFV